MEVGSFFQNPREAALAEKVWALTLTLTPAGYTMHGVHQFFAKIPWTNQRIILARDWITRYREDDGLGGVNSLNRELGNTHYTALEIGNVEHFYVAALMGTLFPNNPFWFGWMSSASLFWEIVVGPGRIAIAKRGLPLPKLWTVLQHNLQHNAAQYAVDAAGLKFGNFYSLYDLRDQLTGK